MKAGLAFASGLLHLRRGELGRAVSMLEPAVEVTADLPVVKPLLASTLGHAYVLVGRVAEALALLEESVTLAAGMGIMSAQSLRVAWLGEAYLADGRADDANREAVEAVALARRHGERGHEAWALRLLGDVAAHRDASPVHEAESQYRRALALASVLGMRPLVAHCHAALGALTRLPGHGTESEEHLATATALYREMGMTYWLERAELKAPSDTR